MSTLEHDLSDLAQAADVVRDLCPSQAPELLAQVDALLERAHQRRRLAPDLTVVALMGATGSGKSSLTNALMGTECSRTSAQRPTTTRPVAVVPAGSPADDAARLLQWLQVSDIVPLADAPVGSTTIVLDVPDIDSDTPAHRDIASRIADTVDVLVWVLDPQKYADASIHRDFLVPMADYAPVTLVVLNQVDRLSDVDGAHVHEHLRQLLVSDGLSVEPLCVSARTGAGVEELREHLRRRARDRDAASARLQADAYTVARGLARALGMGDAPEAGTLTRRHGEKNHESQMRDDLQRAAAQAAGSDIITSALGKSMRRRAHRELGWPLVRWISAWRSDPLRALHMAGSSSSRPRDARESSLARDAQPSDVVGRSSLVPSQMSRGALLASAHQLAAQQCAAWPVHARTDLLARIDERVDAMIPALDEAVCRVPLRAERRWWALGNWCQWLLLMVAVIGGAWLGLIHAARALLLIQWQPPAVGIVPWPVILLACGLAAGALLGIVGRIMAGMSARRAQRTAAVRIRAATDTVTENYLLAPLRHQAQRWQELVDALARVTGHR